MSQIGHSLIPELWPKKLRDELRNPTQHLDTLEEVWWLGCWSGIEDIRRAEQIKTGVADDIDWQFTIGSTGFSWRLKVNLEVKRLKSDNTRQARGREMNAHEFAQFCRDQVLRKFRPSRPDEVNVLGISLFGEIDGSVQRVIPMAAKQRELRFGRCAAGRRRAAHDEGKPAALKLRQTVEKREGQPHQIAFSRPGRRGPELLLRLRRSVSPSRPSGVIRQRRKHFC